MKPRRSGLSKTRLTMFEQCPKRLWLAVHRPEEGELGEGTQAAFATGHAVGSAACGLHPGGVMIAAEPDLAAALAETRRLIAEGHPGPLFEATFEHDGVLVRVDVLSRADDTRWHVAEVKSATQARDYHLGDLATQVWVIEEAGLDLAGAAIRHIDTSFVLEREGDYVGLFADADLFGPAREIARGRPALVAAAKAVLAGEEPDIAMGYQCTAPFACEFAGYCAQGSPPGPEWPVTLLPGGGGRKWAAKGVTDLLDLSEQDLSARHARVLAATRTGEPYHDREGARAALAAWPFPRAWLDFETIALALPLWVGTRPYQQVPFQFSLHLEAADGTITHHAFLQADGKDPRRACSEALAALIPAEATVIAYNASFERSVLRNLARDVPDLAEAMLSIEARTVDLLPVTRETWYHRDQRGSWSIKAVLPTMTDMNYEGLEVKDGGNAQAAFLEAIDPATSPARRWALEEALLAYCERDTWAMVAVARRLVGEG